MKKTSFFSSEGLKAFLKISVVAVFVFVAFNIGFNGFFEPTVPSTTHAQTVTPIAVVSVSGVPNTSSSGACYTFYNNLGVGQSISSSDALALQQVLVAQGLWNATVPITSYTRTVSIAVAALQERYAAEILTPNGLTQPTGYFGPSTRSLLNQLYDCGANTPSSVSVQTFECPTGWTCEPTSWISTSTTTNVPMIPASSSYTTTSSYSPNLSVNPNSFFTLASEPTITKTNISAGGATTTTMEYTATFNVNVHAVTGSLTLGLPNSTDPAFEDNSSSVAIYKNGVADSLLNYNPVISYSAPNDAVVSPDGASFSISQGQTVTIPVTYSFIVTNANANTYAVQLQGIYSSLGLINSMMNQTMWRTASV